MKLTVNNYLNARTGAASTSAPNPYYHEPGKVLEVDSVTTGTCIDGNAIWYHCAEDDHYYWSGGFTEKDFWINGTHLHSFEHGQQVEIVNTVIQVKENGLMNIAEGYIGTGIGYKNDNNDRGLALIVFVDKKTPEKNIPEYIDYCGVRIPTDVNPIEFVSHQIKWDSSPLRLGGSISNVKDKGHGSRGLLFHKLVNGELDDNKVYLLTCYHVLFPGFIKEKKWSYSSTVQPVEKAVLPVNNTDENAQVIIEGEYNSAYDYALVDVTEWYRMGEVVNTFDDDNKTPDDVYTYTELSGKLGLRVTGYGTMTGKKTTAISHVNVRVKIKETGMKFNNIWVAHKLSVPGDSGGPVIDINGGNKVVGYIIGGNEKYSFIMPLDNIIYDKNYRLILK